MRREYKQKLLLLLFIACALIFYVRTVPQVSLTERSIVIGLGLDYDGENYIVSAQMVNPVSGTQGSAGDGYGITCGRGKTIAEAVGDIAVKTGLTISLSQCNLLILGNKAQNKDIFPNLNYLVQSFQMPELAFLIATDKTAVELLRVTPVMTEISSFQLQQTLTAFSEDESVMNTTIKDFIADYLSPSGVVAVAYITAKKVPADDYGGTTQSGGDKDYYEFDYNKSLLLSKKLPPKLMEKEDTQSINLIMERLKKGAVKVPAANSLFALELKNKKYKYKISYENGRITYDGKISGEYVVTESEEMGEYYVLSDITDDVLQKISAAAKEQVEKQISATFEKCRAEGYDIYEIYDKTYAAEGVRFRDSAPDNYLEIIDFKITADIKVTRK